MARPKSESQSEHITIEEATQRGLWRIVAQLKKDSRIRKSLGMQQLQEAIESPIYRRGRPSVKKE